MCMYTIIIVWGQPSQLLDSQFGPKIQSLNYAIKTVLQYIVIVCICILVVVSYYLGVIYMLEMVKKDSF